MRVSVSCFQQLVQRERLHGREAPGRRSERSAEQAVQTGHTHVVRWGQQERPAGPQDAGQLRHGASRVGHVLDRLAGNDHIEVFVGIADVLYVAQLEQEVLAIEALARALDRKRSEVLPDHLAASGLCHPPGELARTATDLDNPSAGADGDPSRRVTPASCTHYPAPDFSHPALSGFTLASRESARPAIR